MTADEPPDTAGGVSSTVTLPLTDVMVSWPSLSRLAVEGVKAILPRIAALTGDQSCVARQREIYRERRDALLDALSNALPDPDEHGVRLRQAVVDAGHRGEGLLGVLDTEPAVCASRFVALADV